MPRLPHLLPHDLGDLLHGLVDLAIVVHDDVVVFRGGGHLDLSVAHPKLALLVGARLAAGGGDVDDGVVELLHQAMDHGVLSGAGGRVDDHEQAAAIDAQRSSSRSGVAVTGVPSPFRYTTRSGASGAVKVRSPPCGSRTVRRQACRN